MTGFVKIVPVFWLLIIAFGSRDALSQTRPVINPSDDIFKEMTCIESGRLLAEGDTAWLEQIGDIDVCGGSGSKNFYLTVNIGNITVQDSLFGYNFSLRYNPLKLRFTAALYINTLSENLEYKLVNIFEDGTISGYGLNMGNIPIIGNLPLLALKGEFLGNCPDTSFVDFSYISFTEEFKKDIENFKGLAVEAVKKEDNSRFAYIKIVEDSIDVLNGTEFDLHTLFGIYDKAALPDSLFLRFTIEGGSNIFSYEKVSSSGENVIIDSSGIDSTGRNIYARLLGGDTLMNFLVLSLRSIATDTAYDNICMEVRISDNCNCISSYIPACLLLKTHPNVETVVEDDEPAFKEYDEILVYNLNGCLARIFNGRDEVAGFENLVKELPAGIYFVLAKKNNIYDKKIKLINNYN